MPCSYYIYYRVDPAKTAAGERRVRELIEAIRKSTGIAGRMMRKRSQPNLWMEIYEGVVDEAKFEWELAEAVDHLKIGEVLLPGTPRHIECFEEP
jgi:hypothetical protein